MLTPERNTDRSSNPFERYTTRLNEEFAADRQRDMRRPETPQQMAERINREISGCIRRQEENFPNLVPQETINNIAAGMRGNNPGLSQQLQDTISGLMNNGTEQFEERLANVILLQRAINRQLPPDLRTHVGLEAGPRGLNGANFGLYRVENGRGTSIGGRIEIRRQPAPNNR